MKLVALALAATLPLTGCAGFAAKSIESADNRCWELTLRQVDQLTQNGDFDGAREILRTSYPPLTSVRVVTELIDDPAGLSTDSSGC